MDELLYTVSSARLGTKKLFEPGRVAGIREPAGIFSYAHTTASKGIVLARNVKAVSVRT